MTEHPSRLRRLLTHLDSRTVRAVILAVLPQALQLLGYAAPAEASVSLSVLLDDTTGALDELWALFWGWRAWIGRVRARTLYTPEGPVAAIPASLQPLPQFQTAPPTLPPAEALSVRPRPLSGRKFLPAPLPPARRLSDIVQDDPDTPCVEFPRCCGREESPVSPAATAGPAGAKPQGIMSAVPTGGPPQVTEGGVAVGPLSQEQMDALTATVLSQVLAALPRIKAKERPGRKSARAKATATALLLVAALPSCTTTVPADLHVSGCVQIGEARLCVQK